MATKQTKLEVVNALYLKKYKPMKLAPAHVTGLKKAMLTAAKKRGAGTKEINAAAKAFIKEKAAAKKKKPADKAKSTKKKGTGRKKGAPDAPDTGPKKSKKKKGGRDKDVAALRAEHNLKLLGEEALREEAKERGVKVKKGASADDIRAAINNDLLDLQSDTPKALASVDLEKIKNCIGLFIDFRDTSCIKCPQQSDCLKKFAKHQASGFKAFEGVRLEVEIETEVEATDEVPTEKPKKGAKKKSKKKRSTGYDLKREIDVFNEPLNKEDDLYAIAKLVKKRVPSTIGALQTIILSVYDPEEDTDESRAQLTKEIIGVFVDWNLIELL